MNDGLIAAFEEARYMRALTARAAQREHLWQTFTVGGAPEHEKKYRCAACKREVFAGPGQPADTPDCPGLPQ